MTFIYGQSYPVVFLSLYCHGLPSTCRTRDLTLRVLTARNHFEIFIICPACSFERTCSDYLTVSAVRILCINSALICIRIQIMALLVT
jgi:hypothetical protein